MAYTFTINADTSDPQVTVEADYYALEHGYFNFKVNGDYGDSTVFTISTNVVVTIRRQ